MYTQAEIEQSYYEATGNSLRFKQATDCDAGWDSYFERTFDEIDELTLGLASEVARG
ncbi:MAG: hypothetical protein WA639_10835 [Candidatus Acidiferrum sp.]